MSNKEFLQSHGLERSLPLKESKVFERLLKKAGESFAIEYTKDLGVKVGRLQYYDFYVYCETRNFADCYAHIGLLWAQLILPIWNKRSAPQKQKLPNKFKY